VQLAADGEYAPLRTILASECHVLSRCVQGERVLTRSVKMVEPQLRRLLKLWTVEDNVTGFSLHLHPELIDVCLSHLKVPRVEMSGVRAVGCSSIGPCADRCAIQNLLNTSTDNWWISGNGKMKAGIGTEWVAFSLGAAGAFRVERVHLCIPMLPSGPLSVRDFYLESAPSLKGPWERASRDLVTLDSAAQQSFHLEPPIEAEFIRIVCTRNAARAVADLADLFYASTVQKVRSLGSQTTVMSEEEEEEERSRHEEERSRHAMNNIESRLSSSVGLFYIHFS